MEGVTNSYIDNLGLRTKPVEQEKMSESDQFLHLMLAQIQNQDPMKPMENGEFLSQLAQMNMASGVSDMKESFSGMAETLQSNQALQASSMVGRTVVVPSENAPLANGKLQGAVALPEDANKIDVRIYSQEGVLVNTVKMGATSSGLIEFSWNGKDASGNNLPEGEYEIKATATYSNGLSESVPTVANAVVESVTIGRGGQGLALNLDGLGSWRMSDVLQIHQ